MLRTDGGQTVIIIICRNIEKVSVTVPAIDGESRIRLDLTGAEGGQHRTATCSLDGLGESFSNETYHLRFMGEPVAE